MLRLLAALVVSVAIVTVFATFASAGARTKTAARQAAAKVPLYTIYVTYFNI